MRCYNLTHECLLSCTTNGYPASAPHRSCIVCILSPPPGAAARACAGRQDNARITAG